MNPFCQHALDDWSINAYIPCMTLTSKAEATRQNLLDTGYRLVLSKGFSALGLQEILKGSGVPKGSFYHYFASKEAFGCALLDDYVTEYGDRLDQLLAIEAENGRQRLLRYWQAWLDPDAGETAGRGWAEDCLAVKLSAEVADLSEAMRMVLSDGIERVLHRITTLIVEARDDGSLPPGPEPEALAQVLYQMWLGAALLAKLTRSHMPMQRAMVATKQLLACPADPTLQTKGTA